MAKLTGLEMIESQKLYLKIFGMWPEENESFFYKIRYYITMGICFGFITLPIIEMPNRLNDYGVLSELVSILVSPLMFCLKILTFQKSKRYLFKLLQNMKEHPVDAFDTDILKALKLSKRLVLAYPSWYFVSVTMFLMKPVFDRKDLPVKFSYNLGRYENVMYAYQVLSLEIIAIGLAFFDTLTINFINIGSAKLEILVRRIKNTSNLKKNLIVEEFSHIVKDHNGLIQYMFYIEEVFTYCFLAQFFNSILTMCNIGLQLTHMDVESGEFVANVMYFLAMLIELALYCWFGNEIVVKSQKVLIACYECSWYEYDIGIRKSILIIMERSKRPLKLTAAKFATLSLQSFAAICRSSYSFFTVMQRMYSKNKGEIV